MIYLKRKKSYCRSQPGPSDQDDGGAKTCWAVGNIFNGDGHDHDAHRSKSACFGKKISVTFSMTTKETC